MNYNIKDMVKDGKKVRFVQYKHNQLWYETECGFRFPVDISDTGDGTFLAEDKAILFMRYINKAIKAIKQQELLDDALIIHELKCGHHECNTESKEEASAVTLYAREHLAKELKPVYDALSIPVEESAAEKYRLQEYNKKMQWLFDQYPPKSEVSNSTEFDEKPKC